MKEAVFKWLTRNASAREVENEALLESIRLLYDQVEEIYGYRRISMTINRYRDIAKLPLYNEKRIYRLMRMYKVQAVIRRKRKGTWQKTC